jgi:alkylhydroperoxidase family enzyme
MVALPAGISDRVTDSVFRGLSSPGTWWSGAQRVQVAREARSAKSCALCAERRAALSAASVAGNHAASDLLPPTAVDVVHRIVTDPGRLTEDWYRAATGDGGLTIEEFVEIVAVVSCLTVADTLHLALGEELRPLPAPEAGEPSQEAGDPASETIAWVPTVDPADATGSTLKAYAMPLERFGRVPNVITALSAVTRARADWGRAFYTALSATTDADGERLTEGQLQLVASATSAANDCFY